MIVGHFPRKKLKQIKLLIFRRNQEKTVLDSFVRYFTLFVPPFIPPISNDGYDHQVFGLKAHPTPPVGQEKPLEIRRRKSPVQSRAFG